jgi:membrane-associated phospholipid phosphatase
VTARLQVADRWPVDWLNYAMLLAMAALTLAWFEEVPHAVWWLLFDFAAIAAVALIGWKVGRGAQKAAALTRLAHGIVVVPLVFTEVGVLIAASRPVDHAATLEKLDRVLFFGVNPIEALERVSAPWLTEVMQWFYTSYLLIPIGIVLLLVLRAGRELVSRSLFALLGVMYLSYVGYYVVPAAGPNIHSNIGPPGPVAIPVERLYTFETDLPGLWLAAPLRDWMFQVELTKKDCFPSGHVAVAIVCWILARRVDRRFGGLFLTLAVGVTVSTVYLRYHYVVDVLAGVLLACFCVTVLPRLHDRLAPS